MRFEVMSGSARGRQLYQMMANGEAVPNEVVNDLLAEAMVKKAESKVRSHIFKMIFSKMNMIYSGNSAHDIVG